MRDLTKLGPTIAGARIAAGMSQADLARRAQLTASHLARVEAGEKIHLHFETVARLAEVLKLSMDDISSACGYRVTRLPPTSGAAAVALAEVLRGLLREVMTAEASVRQTLGALEDEFQLRKRRVRARKPRAGTLQRRSAS